MTVSGNHCSIRNCASRRAVGSGDTETVRIIRSLHQQRRCRSVVKLDELVVRAVWTTQAKLADDQLARLRGGNRGRDIERPAARDRAAVAVSVVGDEKTPRSVYLIRSQTVEDTRERSRARGS